MNKNSSNPNLLVLRELRPLFKTFGLDTIWLFGSRDTGKAQEQSDWDLMVEFSAPRRFEDFMGLKLALEDQLQASGDLLSRSACSPGFLQYGHFY